MRVTYSAGLPRRATGIAGVVLLGAVLAIPGSARANEYTINACQADRTEFSTQAFDDFANRGMMWKRACNPEGPGLRGLVTSNVVRAGRVVRGSRSSFVLTAPAGTRFGRLTWSGQAQRHDCRYALQLWAERPDGPTVAIKNVRANRGCPNRGKTQAAGWPSAHTYNIDGATKIEQRVLCVGSDETPYCSSRRLNYIRTFKAAATVVDVSPPGVTITQDNAFTRGEWVSGRQQVDYAALDNVGVRAARAIVAGVPRADASPSVQLRAARPLRERPGLDSGRHDEAQRGHPSRWRCKPKMRPRTSAGHPRSPCGSTTRRREPCPSRSTEATSGATATTSTSRGPIPTKATVRRSRPAAIASAPSVEPTASPIGVRVRSITSRTSRSRAPANGNSVSGVRTRRGISSLPTRQSR